jgi:hypothetical protein
MVTEAGIHDFRSEVTFGHVWEQGVARDMTRDDSSFGAVLHWPPRAIEDVEEDMW